MKRMLFFVMAVFLAAQGVSAQTEADFKIRDNTDETVTITRYEGWDTDITIPAALGGKPVSKIDDEAFKNADLTSVVIPGSVTFIGTGTFEDN
jgi:hypothetical protein